MALTRNQQAERQQYYAEIAALNLKPLWAVLGQIFTPEPTTPVEPCLWRWDAVRPQVLRAADLVTAEEAERRVLFLANPGLPDQSIPRVTQTLYAGVQIILPGEIARSHRHTASAARFILEGEGAYTAVDGEQTFMSRGDFVLTPNWAWHDHGNTTDEPMIWLDCLDIPLVLQLNQIFYQAYGEERFPVTRPEDYSIAKWGNGLRPRYDSHEQPYSPVVNYKFDRAYQALQTLAEEDRSSPYDDIILEYTNPLTGGPAVPTMSAFLQLLRPGRETRAHRQTSSTVYLAVMGSGVTEIDGKEYAWQENDVFVVPTWAQHCHVNTENDEAILFSFSDEAALRALGLYREREA